MESACFGPSLEPLKHLIEDEQYHTFTGTTTTVCCLILKTGETVLGSSALTIEEFRSELGRGEGVALQNALAMLIRLECNRQLEDSDSVPTINGEPFEAVKGPRPSK